MAAQDTEQLDYSTIVRIIRDWPIEERLALMHEILRTLAPADGAPTAKHTWEQASGLLAGPWPAPTDEEVDSMLSESRMEQHG